MSTLFSERLKTLRKSRKLSQEDLAKALGVSRSTIAGYEAPSKLREPDLTMVRRLADYFGVSTDYLLGKSPDPERHVVETQATHRTDDYDEPLPEEALRFIEEFKQYLREKYRKKE